MTIFSVPKIEKIDRARALARQLAESTEALNRALERAEGALRSLELGVTAQVPLQGSGDTVISWLAWTREGNHWCLTVLYVRPVTSAPLLKSSRLLRVTAAHALEPLVDALCDAVIAQTATTEAALETVKDALVGLQRGDP